MHQRCVRCFETKFLGGKSAPHYKYVVPTGDATEPWGPRYRAEDEAGNATDRLITQEEQCECGGQPAPGIIRMSTAEEVDLFGEEWKAVEKSCPWRSTTAVNRAAQGQYDFARHAGFFELTLDFEKGIAKQGSKAHKGFVDLETHLKGYGKRRSVRQGGLGGPGMLQEGYFDAWGQYYINCNVRHPSLPRQPPTSNDGKKTLRDPDLHEIRAPILQRMLSERKTQGEKGGKGAFPMQARESHADELLYHLTVLMDPTGLWRKPLVRPICHIHEEDFRRVQASDGEESLTLRFHVYVSRLLFELISCEHLRVLFAHLRMADWLYLDEVIEPSKATGICNSNMLHNIFKWYGQQVIPVDRPIHHPQSKVSLLARLHDSMIACVCVCVCVCVRFCERDFLDALPACVLFDRRIH